MKFKIYLKDPDGFYDGVQEAAEQLAEDECNPNSAVFGDLVEAKEEEVWDGLSSWTEYREYVTLEFDTETGDLTVVPQ